MEPWQERTALMFGDDGLDKLAAARVAVVGLGGVGAMAAEMLVRAGVGHVLLVDADTVSVSNINRQLPALHSTVGRSKCSVVSGRLMDINPSLDLKCCEQFVHEDSVGGVLEPFAPEVVVDAIDTVTGKLAIIENANKAGVPVISSMGTGNKTDPAALEVVDQYESYVAYGISGFINIFRPEIVLIGGGISAEGDYLLKPIRQKLKNFVFAQDIIGIPPVTHAKLGNAAGTIGAAFINQA